GSSGRAAIESGRDQRIRLHPVPVDPPARGGGRGGHPRRRVALRRLPRAVLPPVPARADRPAPRPDSPRDDPRPAAPGRPRDHRRRGLLRGRGGHPGAHAPSPLLARFSLATVATTQVVSTRDVDGLNAGYARALLEDYLENPSSVPSEWR